MGLYGSEFLISHTFQRKRYISIARTGNFIIRSLKRTHMRTCTTPETCRYTVYVFHCYEFATHKTYQYFRGNYTKLLLIKVHLDGYGKLILKAQHTREHYLKYVPLFIVWYMG